MGQFRIIVTAVGGHGQDRSKKDGEKVDFQEQGQFTPDAIAEKFVKELQHFGVNVEDAKIVHWPESDNEVTDDLVSGTRTGNF